MKSIRLAEWVSLVLSLAVIAALFAYLFLFPWKGGGKTPSVPKIEVRMQDRHVEGERAIVPVDVTNGSKSAIKGLIVEVDGTDVTIDYLPAESHQTIFVITTKDAGGITARPKTYLAD